MQRCKESVDSMKLYSDLYTHDMAHTHTHTCMRTHIISHTHNITVERKNKEKTETRKVQTRQEGRAKRPKKVPSCQYNLLKFFVTGM